MISDTEANFIEWRDSLPPLTQVIAIQRALNALDWPYELKPGGGLILDEELDFESDEFQDAIHTAFLQMYIQEGLDEAVEEGLIVTDGIDEDGNLVYVLA